MSLSMLILEYISQENITDGPQTCFYLPITRAAPKSGRNLNLIFVESGEALLLYLFPVGRKARKIKINLTLHRMLLEIVAKNRKTSDQ